MSFEITCPYCFRKMLDTEVHFRSELVNHGEGDILPEDFDDFEDFLARYRGKDKETIISQYRDWIFFREGPDKVYEEFWERFNGTTEVNPADAKLGVMAYHRKVIDPSKPEHQKYLQPQSAGNWFIYDGQGMAAQVELRTGERCNRRVCRHCHNPLPDNYGKNPVKFATIVGITGAGKTVYLSQLLRYMGLYTAKAGLTSIVTNPSVQTFLNNNAIRANHAMPGSTPATRFQQPLFFELVQDTPERGHIADTFVLYDVAGEVFTSPALVSKFAPFVEHADGVIVLIDPMQFNVISNVKAGATALSNATTALDSIYNIIAHGVTTEKCQTPFAICISKADTAAVQEVFSPNLRACLLNDVQPVMDGDIFPKPKFNAANYNPILNELFTFIQANEMSLALQMKNHYANYAYFAFTALGCDVEEGISGNGTKYQFPVGPVLPKRVEEPLLWLFHKLGYIGLNAPIDDPTRPKVPCPRCGNPYTDEIPDGDYILGPGIIFRRKVYVNRVCSCGHRWEHT